MDQRLGTLVGRYRLERLIGRGGMAWVYQAHDPAFARTVAIKVLSPKLSGEPQYVERFLREARSMARLQHPHILPVHDVGEQGGSAYLVMRYVDGGSLHERLAATRTGEHLSLRDLLAIMRPVAEALDYAHRHGVIHRDVKPQNILLTAQQFPFLSDFGIAKIIDGSASMSGFLTLPDAVIGTPDYMSPEQIQGVPLDGRSDLYSLGVILYEVFTGRTPFRGETPVETPLAIMTRHITTPPPPPRDLNPQLPPAMEAVLLRALAKEPHDRYPTGAALLDALEAAVESMYQPPAQGIVASASRSDYRLPPTPLPPPHPPWPDFDPGPAEAAEVAAGPTSRELPAPDAGAVATPVAGAAGVGAGRSSTRAGRRPGWPLVVGAAALLALLAIFALRAVWGMGVAPGGAPTGTVAASVAIATGPTGVAAPSASAASAASVQPTAGAGATAPPSPLVTPPPSARAGGAATPSGAVVPAGAATPTVARTEEVILFSSHRNNVHDSQIYTMNTDGSGQRVLISTTGHSWGPRVSPDGKYFVFSAVITGGQHTNHSATGGGQQGSGHHEIFRARTDGSDIQQLTRTDALVWNNAWAWSPDSKSVVFASDRDGNWELYRMDADGKNVARLTDDPAQDGWPAWTADGRSIIFASHRVGGLSQIFIMDADGKNARRLIASESDDTLPSVSRDGRSVVYASRFGDLSEIYIMDLDATTPARLTSTVAINTDPSFSPDGSKIVFTSDREGNTNIYVMGRDGKNLVRLTDDPGEDVTPYWAAVEVITSSPGDAGRALARPIDELYATVTRRDVLRRVRRPCT